MRISYSALETYKQCPQKYKFQEIDKRKAPKSKEAVFGTLVHASLKHMFSREPLFPTLDEVIANFRQNWKTAREKLRLSEDEEQIYVRQGESILRRFYEKNPPWNYNVIDLESRFEVVLENPKTKEVHILTGIIDRIDKPSENEYEIIDYKTTRRMSSQENVDKNLQLALYQLGLIKRWPHIDPKKITLSLYYVKHNEKLSSHRSQESIETIKTQLLETIDEIEKRMATNDFPAVPSSLCDWCAYKPICPAWRFLYKKPEQATIEDQKIKEVIQEYFKIKKEEQDSKKRMAELQKTINQYLDQEKLDRVFGDNGTIARKLQERYSYNFEQVKTVLEEAGMNNSWDLLLSPDEKKVKVVLKTLPEEIAAKVTEARTLTKAFHVLTASMKKVSLEPSDAAVEQEGEEA
jgi:putative RecB family exonuclease